MAKPSLLQMTQRILSRIDGDEVNSIADTVEATQIANLIKDIHDDIVDEYDLPHNGDLINLEGLANTSKPTHMRIPEGASLIKWIKYDNRTNVSDPRAYATIQYLSPEDFVNLVNARDSTASENQVVLYNANTPLIIRNNAGPTYWTSFDDEYIVFDSFNSAVDTTLQTSKVMSHGYERPELDLEDDAVPDLPENLFSLLRATALSTAFSEYKQEINPKAEQRERRFRIRAQRNKWREARMDHDDVNFGRK